MPETKYSRDTQRFDSLGLDLNRPVDSVKPGKFPYLKNVRSYQSGRLEGRFGLTDIDLVVAGLSPCHSARRLNDPSSDDYTRIVGVSSHLAYGQTSFTDIDSGYSGNPLGLVPWKPASSPTPFMYVADSSRMRKIDVNGNLHTMGWAAPTAAPTVGLTTAPKYKVVDSFQTAGDWTQGGTAGAPSNAARVSTTIANIVYDTGSTGWAGINPTSTANIGPLMRLIFDAAGTPETATVQSVYPGAGAATTIASISYDSGTSGLCSIVLTTPVDQVACDALLRNSTVGPENVRIIAVTLGPNGDTSLRASTSGTWAAGNTVAVLPTFRVYVTGTYAAAATLTTSYTRSAVTVGTGTLTNAGALDLSLFASGVPVHRDDLMHISIRVSDPTVITEIKALLDVDVSSNDFTKNYYWKSFRASDLTPAASNLQSLLNTKQQVLQREIIDQPSAYPANAPPEIPQPYTYTTPEGETITQPGFDPNSPIPYDPYEGITPLTAFSTYDPISGVSRYVNPTSQQLDPGVSQWVELTFRIGDLIRVGSDMSQTLANVASLRITALVTGSVNLDLDSWWIGGGYGPDTYEPTATPYFYRYRVRNPASNVASNFSPAARYQARPLRQSVTVTPTQYAAPSGTSLATTDFVLDIERYGGEIADWHYVGTIANDASPSFADIYADDIVAGQPILLNDNFQPWPILGAPVTGTSGTVAGTTLNDSSTTFSLSWAPGTRILVNNQPYTIYKIISTSKLETVENMGSQSSVVWRIDEPTILAQPLPCLWEQNNTFFACGDPTNPGRLYYSNPNSETTTPTRYLDVTSPSQPLMNGLAYNIRNYVFSSEDFFQIMQTGNAAAPYEHQRIPNGKGLFSRWGLTREPSPIICFLSKDGIYITTGGAPSSLTDDDLLPLFPNEGNPGVDTNGVSAPIMTAANAPYLRLAFYDNYLYFDYPTEDLGRATLALQFDGEGESLKYLGWYWDVYDPNIVFHYGEEGPGVHALLCGSGDGHLMQYIGDTDDGSAIECEFTTKSLDQGVPRENKLFGDVMIDADTEALTVAITPFFNNNESSVAAVNMNTSSRALTTIPLGSSWQTYRNISINAAWVITDERRPKFYIWEPRYTFESAPIAAISWEISPSSFGMDNFKSIGLCKITHVSSVDLHMIFTVDGTAQSPIVITNSSGAYVQTIFRVPVMKGKLYKLRLASSDGETDFRLDGRDSFVQVKNWGSNGAYDELRVFGDYSLVEG